MSTEARLMSGDKLRMRSLFNMSTTLWMPYPERGLKIPAAR
jgi:hypothetical protein